MDYSEIIDLLFDNIKKILFPEEWLQLDRVLSKQEVFAMLLINRQGTIIMSQIAEYVNIPMSTATGIVDRLVRNGYCVRHRSESDRRIVMISLTDKAKKIVADIKNIGSDYMDRIMNILTKEEQKQLTTIIVKIFNELQTTTTQNTERDGEPEEELQKIPLQ